MQDHSHSAPPDSMLSSNWLPLPWKIANDEAKVFRVTELAKSHRSAVAAWKQWDTSRDDNDKSAMNIALTTYLQYASDTKYQILTTGWAGFGVAIISNSTRLTAYWFLVLTILGLGIATAWYEDFPGAIEKPNPVCILDMVAHVTEFVLEVCHAWAPRLCNIFQFVSLAGGSGWRIGRAFLISKKVPKTPITSRRDWFNTFGLAVLHGVKWAFGLMAWPATAIPLTGHGEPFAQVQGTGKWLTREERRQLLAVVHSSPLPVARLPLPDAIIDP